ncbi:hypothetical protein OsI_34651 [Oryza sativa Indica Group]|uniref:Uncharacterized protein n=1 Tax=Oryza sativa subsp. indica TaxID=39946 RepID=B8BI91_ORYSI|nr:hypothetical protein OsI_34651 [Oryza sativa Indica Group]
MDDNFRTVTMEQCMRYPLYRSVINERETTASASLQKEPPRRASEALELAFAVAAHLGDGDE